MELHGKRRMIPVSDALAGSVVDIPEPFLRKIRVDAARNDRIAVVLAGNVNSSGLKIFYRLVGAAVSVFELAGRKPVCQR